MQSFTMRLTLAARAIQYLICIGFSQSQLVFVFCFTMSLLTSLADRTACRTRSSRFAGPPAAQLSCALCPGAYVGIAIRPGTRRPGAAPAQARPLHARHFPSNGCMCKSVLPSRCYGAALVCCDARCYTAMDFKTKICRTAVGCRTPCGAD
jgi:hypothetical protein